MKQLKDIIEISNEIFYDINEEERILYVKLKTLAHTKIVAMLKERIKESRVAWNVTYTRPYVDMYTKLTTAYDKDPKNINSELKPHCVAHHIYEVWTIFSFQQGCIDILLYYHVYVCTYTCN